MVTTNKTTITLVKKLISDYNARLSSDRIFRDVEKAYIKSSLAKDPLANDITNILNRLLTKEIKQDPEIAEAFYYNNKKFSNKDMHLDLTSDRIDGSILIEEQTVITKNSIELKKESKITTKKIVSIELNTSIAKNILKKLDKNSKFLKDFCADYVNSLNSGVIEYDKSGQVRFPSLAFSVQVKKYISDKIKNNDHLDLEEINALNKQIDFFAKLDLMPSTLVLNYIYKNNGKLHFDKKMDDWNLNKPVNSNGAAYADFDNDGYLDMIYGGTQANGTGTVNIYKISKDTTIKTVPNYTFKVTTLPNNLAQLISANDPQNIQFAFGDLNKDKTFDLITTYEGAGFARFTDIYTNVFDSATKSNVFSKFTGFTLPKIKNGKIELVDFNNDGLLDVSITGYATGIGEIFNVYQNGYTKDKGLNFVNVTTSGLQPVQNSKTTWGDYNGDGYPDVIFSGDRDGFGYVTKMATSSKGASGFTQFNELVTFPFGNFTKLTPSMGDIGGDGQLGFVLVGSEKDPLYPTNLYKSFRILQNVRNAASKVVIPTENKQANLSGQKVSFSNSSTINAKSESSAFMPLNFETLTTRPFASDTSKIDQELNESVYLANAAPSSPELKTLNVVKKRLIKNKLTDITRGKVSVDYKMKLAR